MITDAIIDIGKPNRVTKVYIIFSLLSQHRINENLKRPLVKYIRWIYLHQVSPGEQKTVSLTHSRSAFF